ncbi:MAG: ATP-binding cassette domain-containing protein, partial [Alphaproteobacteria bacterium]|nr:ATP-binding cassette domain-containing protein [Alphaproteobacteria bacterium]
MDHVTASARTPTRRQFQTTECGVAILGIMLSHFGRHVPLEELRAATGVSRECVSAADMARAARAYGLECKPLRREPEQLAALGFPCVVHLRFIHFVVLEAMDDERVVFNDPSIGRLEMPRAQFHEDFTGIVLRFSPGPDFRPTSPRRGPTGICWTPPVSRAFAWAALLGLAEALMPVAAALLLARGLLEWAAGAALVHLAAGALGGSAWIDMRRGLAAAGTDSLRRRLRALPFGFFLYRLPDPLTHTMYSAESVARLLCLDILPAAVRTVALPAALAAAWSISPRGALVLAVLTVLHLGAMAALARWRTATGRELRAAEHSDQAELASTLDDLEIAKVADLHREFLAEGLGKHAARNRLAQEWGVAVAALRTLAAHFQLVAGAAILLAGALEGGPGPGSTAALIVLALALGRVLDGLSGMAGKWDDLDSARSPVADVLDVPPEPPRVVAEAPPDGGVLRAAGVTFGYAPLKPPLLKNLDLVVSPGEVVGITGPSGGGKSTLAGILAGMVRPWSGQVRLDGAPLADLAPARRARMVAWVDKNVFVHEGGIRDNVVLWDIATDERALEAAIRDACLDEVLADRPGGVGAMVEPLGRNFSGGQLQRIEIARALVRRPSLVILDEATDALDAGLEERLLANLRRRGCTVVVISHRVSTLAACDRVVRVVGGVIAT